MTDPDDRPVPEPRASDADRERAVLTLGREPPPPGAPVVRIRLISVMGGGQVQRGRKRRRELDA